MGLKCKAEVLGVVVSATEMSTTKSRGIAQSRDMSILVDVTVFCKYSVLVAKFL